MQTVFKEKMHRKLYDSLTTWQFQIELVIIGLETQIDLKDKM